MCIFSQRGDSFLSLLQDRSDVHPQLSGYGVELSVKSTEYKAMDDSKVQGVVMTTTCHVTCITRSCLLYISGDEGRTVDQSQGDDEVEGFLFNILRYSTTSCAQSKEA